MPHCPPSDRIPARLLPELRPLFLSLKEVPPAELESALASTCADPETRRAVARLLRHHRVPQPGRNDPLRAERERPPNPRHRRPPPRLRPGDQVGAYRLLSRTAGGIGEVWRARTRDGHDVALKTLRPDALLRFGSVVADRFESEIQVCRAVGLGGGLCRFIDHGALDGSPYLVVEWIDGNSLEERLQRDREGRPRALAPELRLLEQTAWATHRLHRLGFVHRDLKPANVMIRPCQVPVLIDFGLALRADSDQRITGLREVLGTPAYMAPEQRIGAYVPSPRTDVYALGAMLYEILTLDPPKRIEALGHLQHPTKACPRARNPAVTRRLQSVCRRALDADPHRRYPTAAEFARALGDQLPASTPRSR